MILVALHTNINIEKGGVKGNMSYTVNDKVYTEHPIMDEIVYNQMSCNSRKLWEELCDARKNAVSFVKELDTI